MPHGFLHRVSWRAFRLGALLLLAPVTLVLLAGLGVLWRLSSGPTDVTVLAAHWLPVPVQAGTVPGRPAGRLTGERFYLSWKPGHRHLHPELLLDIVNLRILRQDGSATLALGKAHMTVPMAPLLEGHIRPLSLSAENGTVILRRSASGGIDLDWPDARHTRSGRTPLTLEKLISVHADNLSVILIDVRPRHNAKLKIFRAALSRQRDDLPFSWAGHVETALGVDALPPMKLSATGRTGPSGVSWIVRNDAVQPDRFAAFLPVLGLWHLPVQLTVGVMLPFHARSAERDLPFSTFDVHATLGQGTISQTDQAPLTVMGGQGAVAIRNDARQVVVDLARSSITLRDDAGQDATFSVQGAVSGDHLFQPRIVNGTLAIDATSLDIAHLASIWPQMLMKGARKWVARNLTAGTAEGLRVSARLHSDRGWAGLRPVGTTAALAIHGATVYWLRPVPPVTDVSAHFAFATSDSLRITLEHGVQSIPGNLRPLTLVGGSVLIDDLFERDQMGTIRFDLAGDLASGLALLAHPRLHLLSRHPLPFTDPAGSITVGAELTLPLSSHIEDDQIHVAAHVQYQDVSLGNVLLGRGVTQTSGTIDATERHLALRGAGQLGGVPTTATLDENFSNRDGPVREEVHAVSVFDPQALARASPGVGHLFDGSARLSTGYVARFDGSADVRLDLDLADASLTIPVWRKGAGVPATASAHLGLQKGAVVVLDQVRAEGPDLHIEGNGVIGSGHVQAVSLARFRVGRSQGDARIDLPSGDHDPIAVHVRAKTLDVAPLLHPEGTGHAETTHSVSHSSESKPVSGSILKSKPGTQSDWSVDIQAARLYYSARGSFGNVVAHLVHRHNRLDQGSFTAEAPTHVHVTLTPRSTGRALHAEIGDLGCLLRETGLTSRLSGGTARISGQFADGGEGSLPPFKGLLSVTPFTFLKPPAALTAATHLSVFQWSQASQDRFEVRHLHLPVSIGRDVMTIRDGHLGNPALGATLEGEIGLMQGHLDLNGTVVPVFGLNAAPGRLPNVGKLFAPEKGGGLIAATFTVKGTADDPDLSVNPFAMFLPGVMRQLAK